MSSLSSLLGAADSSNRSLLFLALRQSLQQAHLAPVTVFLRAKESSSFECWHILQRLG